MRLCIVITAAVALVLGAILFTGQPGEWRMAIEATFLVSIVLFLWLLVRVIAQRLNALASQQGGDASQNEQPTQGR